MVQKDQKLYPSCLTSQEPYIIWSSFMVHMCKKIIFPGVFLYFFQSLIFGVNNWVKDRKWPKMRKKMFLTLYLRNGTSYDCGSCCTCYKKISKQFFFNFFFKFWFFKVLGQCGWVKGQKMTQNCQFQSVARYISKPLDHIIKVFVIQV